jgi:hypothetical protein
MRQYLHHIVVQCIILALAGLATSAWAGSGRVLYSPHRSNHTKYSAGYPRVVQLHHSGEANGMLLATFSLTRPHPKTADFPIYRSTDHGKTWSSKPISNIHATRKNWDIDAPTLFELPRAEGDLPAGALLAAGTAWRRGDFTQQAIEVFVSRDHGLTWTYRSNCAAESHMGKHAGHGIWEPEFAIAADGSLVCYFSDERASAHGYNQVLAHKTSVDGGRTWSREVYDVAIKDNVQRPGMATVVRLPNGRYAMTFEDCQAGYDPDTTCSVYFKISPDGLNWKPVSSLGSLIQTRGGDHFQHTPYLAWSPADGQDGALIVSGQRVVTGKDGSIRTQPESGRVLMINTRLGKGFWRQISAPFTIAPIGGYDKKETGCPGYSSPILGFPGGNRYLFMAGTRLSGGNGRCEIRYGLGAIPMPHHG